MSEGRFIEKPPEGVEGWREVWRDDLRHRYDPPTFLHRIAYLLLRPVINRLMSLDGGRQRSFNSALLDMISDVRGDVDALRAEVAATTREVQRVRELLPVGVKRNDALIAALDRKIEAVASRIRDLSIPLLEAPQRESLRNDFVYRRLEDALRGGDAETREHLMPYVELCRDLQPVIDVGCGRGELLGLLRHEGIEARGFDLNERSVADLRELGLLVEMKGIPECFEAIHDHSVGAVVATHVVEHLDGNTLVALFAESHRVLRSNGLLIIETPNAESLAMSARDFWRDPTHLAPRHRASLVLIAREFDFEIAEISAVHEYPDAERLAVGSSHPADLQEAFIRLNALLFGPQDLRAVFRKR